MSPDQDRKVAVGISAVTMATLAAGAVGFVQGVYVLRQLGAENYGLAAVVLALGSVAANLIDFRIGDVVAREFYAWHGDPDEPSARAGALRVGLLASIMTGAAIAVATAVIGILWVRYVTSEHIGMALLLPVAISQATSHVGSYLLFVLRLTTRWKVLAASQVVASVTNTALVVVFVTFEQTPAGYLYGALAASACNVVIAFVVAARCWSRANLPVFDRRALTTFRSDWRSLALAGSVLGFSKLLHRAADTLLVAAFCDARHTGMYRFARTSTDALYMVFDAANKIVQPQLLQWLGGGRIEQVRRLVSRIVTATTGFGVVVLSAEFALLPMLIGLIGPSYSGAEPLIMLLTIPVLAVLGVQMWLWPVLVHHGRASHYAVVSLVGIVVIQYAVPAAVAITAGGGSALPFAAGYSASYVWTLALPILMGWDHLRPYIGAREVIADAQATTA